MYLFQGNHHEVALVHQRMGYLQIRLIDGQVIVKENVDVDRTVFIEVRDMFFPSQSTFYFLSGFKELSGRESGLYKDDAIQKLMLRFKSPRLGLN